MDNLRQLKQVLQESVQIVFFGGAGTSTESGIPDFRSADGLYSNQTNRLQSPEDILSRSFFLKEPEAFYTFYKSNMIHVEAKPNAAHLALAKLEQQGRLQTVITQNIDGLHQLAGSRKVLELHGSVHRNHCVKCKKAYPIQEVIHSAQMVPTCETCGGIIKPDVVLYEENLDQQVMEQAISSISKAEVLIVAGTSLTVYPAAGMIRYFQGHTLVLINKEKTSFDEQADLVIHERVGQVLSEAMKN
ncbi:NAD-dependent protein deacylase [Marinicrinis sediminis]|uniref:NAD-dependent protein deacetylase n=1 Tax=Marinicrinis sediminis TaxID=1652465 RepID=A0ABW5R6I5_9BACL